MFDWLQAQGNVADGEMHRTFNCGIGMVLAVDAAQADAVMRQLSAAGESAWRIGSIEAGKYADFVVLDKNPQEVGAKTIKDIKVIATVTAGRAMLTSQTRNPNW